MPFTTAHQTNSYLLQIISWQHVDIFPREAQLEDTYGAIVTDFGIIYKANVCKQAQKFWFEQAYNYLSISRF